MSRRKDAERFRRLKAQNPDYVGFRGVNTAPAKPVPVMESVTCSVCNRKRNADRNTLPEDRSRYVCVRCRADQGAPAPAAE